jgi:chromosome segregation ATPase
MHASNPNTVLQTLRAAIEDRLAVLDAVLADPSRGESLEVLILDLARMATEEAQVAAAKACVDTKLRSESEFAEARVAAQTALDQEQTISVRLRQALNEAQQRITILEGDKQAALRSAQAQLDRSAAREQETVAGAARAAEEARTQLQAERAAVAELRGTAARVDALSVALEQQESKTLTSIQRLTADVARERGAAADARQMLADARAQLDSATIREREAVAHLEQTVQEVRKQLAAAVAAQEHLDAELAREREAAAASARQALTDAGAQVEGVRQQLAAAGAAQERLEAEFAREREAAASAHQTELAHAARDHAQRVEQHSAIQQELASVRAETEALRADLYAARHHVEELEVQLIGAFVSPEPSAVSSVAVPSELESAAGDPGATDAPRKDSAPASPPSDDGDEWASVRLANRYAFPKPVEVMANGESGLLLDLSESGCQLLSRGALKLNQTIRVVLPSEAKPVAWAGKIVWARLEAPAGGRPLTYRAGVQFTKRDDEAIAAFVARHGAS